MFEAKYCFVKCIYLVFCADEFLNHFNHIFSAALRCGLYDKTVANIPVRDSFLPYIMVDCAFTRF